MRSALKPSCCVNEVTTDLCSCHICCCSVYMYCALCSCQCCVLDFLDQNAVLKFISHLLNEMLNILNQVSTVHQYEPRRGV